MNIALKRLKMIKMLMQTDHADKYVTSGIQRLDRRGFHGELHQPCYA